VIWIEFIILASFIVLIGMHIGSIVALYWLGYPGKDELVAYSQDLQIRRIYDET